MTLEYLQNEMYNAMKSKDTIKKDVLASIISNVKKTAIDRMCKDTITEQLVDEVILKEKKVLQEMIDTCPADRVETLNTYIAKLGIVESYAPKIISEIDEIHELILHCCAGIEFTMKNKGLIMKTISAQYKGKVDMKAVQEVVNSLMA